jgi:carboxypeptidase C (cathepsin A)
MTGGPGCSGLLALFEENGPYHIEKNLSLSINPYSWNSYANVMWIDQPVGAGFSYNKLGDLGVLTETEMAEDMYEFLQIFFTQFSNLTNLEFYVTGESYAGHYVPALSAFIERKNKLNSTENIFINLKGSAIGNGLVDPYIQYRYYAPFAYEHGVINKATYEIMEAALDVCLPLIKECSLNSSLGYLICINAYTVCNYLELEPVLLSGINPYDVRIKCQVPPLCYDFSLVKEYLAQPSVMEALGVTGHPWIECNRFAEMELVFAGDWMLNYAVDIPELLATDHRILIYAGEYDFICNWLGNSEWVAQLSWPGNQSYANAPNTTWTNSGSVAGTFLTAEGLTFIKVNNAGHMVPMNQPQNALDMITRFIRNETFGQ